MAERKAVLTTLDDNHQLVLPNTASVIGIDLNTGKQLYYNTSSHGWSTQETITASYGVFSQNLTASNLQLTGNPGVISNVVGPLLITSSLGITTSGSIVISGSRSDLGTEQTSVLINGDLFVSGGIGLNDYIQLKPVGTLRIPTNITSSYIYTSGSTNDLYFTQYNGPYTNTTRLRWIESSLVSGLLHGGILTTVNGTTTFSVTSGSGIIVSQNATTTSDTFPTIQKVDWPAYISQSLTYVSSAQLTYIGINPANSQIIQRTTPFADGDFEQYIVLGRVLHQSGSVTNGTSTSPKVSYATSTSYEQFIRSFGPLKISGHVLAASGSTLGLTKTGGDSYVKGRNYAVDANDPDYIKSTSDYALTTSKIFREYVNGSGNFVVDTGIANAGYTTIDPTKYNNGGTLASVPGGKYSIQRVYWFPNAVTRALYVYYGNATYNSLDIAEAAIKTENFTEGANTSDAAILVAYLLVIGNASDLSNTTQARFVQAGTFRAIAGVGGGGAGGSTTPGGLDTYVQFNDGGSTFNGVSTFTFNKTTNTLSVANAAISGSFFVTGSLNLHPVNETNTDVTAGSNQNTINMIGLTAPRTVTLPTPVTGAIFRVVNGDGTATSGSYVFVTGSSNATIDGKTHGHVAAAQPYGFTQYYCTNNNWVVENTKTRTLKDGWIDFITSAGITAASSYAGDYTNGVQFVPITGSVLIGFRIKVNVASPKDFDVKLWTGGSALDTVAVAVTGSIDTIKLFNSRIALNQAQDYFLTWREKTGGDYYFFNAGTSIQYRYMQGASAPTRLPPINLLTNYCYAAGNAQPNTYLNTPQPNFIGLEPIIFG